MFSSNVSKPADNSQDKKVETIGGGLFGGTNISQQSSAAFGQSFLNKASTGGLFSGNQNSIFGSGSGTLFSNSQNLNQGTFGGSSSMFKSQKEAGDNE